MKGKLMRQARKDAAQITTSIGWESTILLTTPDKSKFVYIKGIFTSHNMTIDELGQRVNSKNSAVLIAEKDLLNAFKGDFSDDFNDDFSNTISYPYRNKATGNIALINHTIEVDGKEFVINETYPSETVGLILCTLGDINKKNSVYGNFNKL